MNCHIKNVQRPPRLFDPLLVLGRLLIGVNLVNLWFSLRHGGGVVFAIVILIPVLIFVFPMRRTDIIYCRKFNSEPDSQLLKQLRRLIPARLRMSGIRNPKRRIHTILWPIAPLIVLIRYKYSKFLNLEAEDYDWLARLWRSLQDCRAVIIDMRHSLSVPKDNVLREARVCVKSAKLSRILFIVDSSKTPDEWRRVLVMQLNLCQDVTDGLRLALWTPGNTISGEFEKDVKCFFRNLPDKKIPVDKDTFRYVKHRAMERDEIKAMKRAMILKARYRRVGYFVVGLLILALIIYVSVSSEEIFWRWWQRLSIAF